MMQTEASTLIVDIFFTAFWCVTMELPFFNSAKSVCFWFCFMMAITEALTSTGHAPLASSKQRVRTPAEGPGKAHHASALPPYLLNPRRLAASHSRAQALRHRRRRYPRQAETVALAELSEAGQAEALAPRSTSRTLVARGGGIRLPTLLQRAAVASAVRRTCGERRQMRPHASAWAGGGVRPPAPNGWRRHLVARAMAAEGEDRRARPHTGGGGVRRRSARRGCGRVRRRLGFQS